MLQRGLLTIAEQKPPYHRTTATKPTNEHTATMEQELNKSAAKPSTLDITEDREQLFKCLPIVEMPQIKIERDYERAMEEDEQMETEMATELAAAQIEEDDEEDELNMKPVPQLLEPTSILKTSLLTGAANTLATLTAAAEQIARMPPLPVTDNGGQVQDSKEPPPATLVKSYPYYNEENKRVLFSEDVEMEKSSSDGDGRTERESLLCLASSTASETRATPTYTSILQTALMSKRPATLNVAPALTLTSSSSSSSVSAAAATSSSSSTSTLHVRTPDQVLKTAVTLATLSEISAQREQQQLQQIQQQQQDLTLAAGKHILVVPQVAPRKMCTLPFKKLNFANITSLPNTASISSSSTSACCTATTSTSTSSNNNNINSTITATNTATTIAITNNNLNSFLGSNIKTSSNNNIINLCHNNPNNNNNNQAASSIIQKTNPHNNSNNNNANANNSNSGSGSGTGISIAHSRIVGNTQVMATQTLKIPCVKPHLVTSQTQTEEVTPKDSQTLNKASLLVAAPTSVATSAICFAPTSSHSTTLASSLQTASSSSQASTAMAGGGLLRTAVSSHGKMAMTLAQTASTFSTSASPSPSSSSTSTALAITLNKNLGSMKTSLKSSVLATNKFAATTATCSNVTSNILKASLSQPLSLNVGDKVAGAATAASLNTFKLATTNVAGNMLTKFKTEGLSSFHNMLAKPPRESSSATNSVSNTNANSTTVVCSSSSTATSPPTAVTVVVFETLLPED